jgi:DnaJ-class molecular chaperone
MGGQIRGANIFDEIEIEFEESLRGVEKLIKYDRIVVCNSCDGK